MAAHVSNRGGLVERHLMALQQIAHQHNLIIGVRPVDRMAAQLIEDGHPTKGFHIKGKSASWGPQTSLIPVDQSLSKLQAKPDRIASSNAQVQSAIKDRHAVAVPLVISQARLDALVRNQHVSIAGSDDARKRLSLDSVAPDGTPFRFEAVRLKSNGEDRYVIQLSGKPVQVLAPRAEAKPITADYDLFVVAPHMSDYGPQDKLPVPFVAHSVYKEFLDKYHDIPARLRPEYESPGAFYKNEDKDIGNASPRVREIIGVINQALAPGGEPVVHHNADSGSPATSVADNYPLSFALPTKIGRFDEICVVKDKSELAALARAVKNAGYHFPMNPLWETEITSVSTVRETSRALSDR